MPTSAGTRIRPPSGSTYNLRSRAHLNTQRTTRKQQQSVASTKGCNIKESTTSVSRKSKIPGSSSSGGTQTKKKTGNNRRKVPDFKKLHSKWQKQLEIGKACSKKPCTQVQEFDLTKPGTKFAIAHVEDCSDEENIPAEDNLDIDLEQEVLDTLMDDKELSKEEDRVLTDDATTMNRRKERLMTGPGSVTDDMNVTKEAKEKTKRPVLGVISTDVTDNHQNVARQERLSGVTRGNIDHRNTHSDFTVKKSLADEQQEADIEFEMDGSALASILNNKGVEIPKPQLHVDAKSRQTIATVGNHKNAATVPRERPSIYYKKPQNESPTKAYRDFQNRFVQKLTLTDRRQTTISSTTETGVQFEMDKSSLASILNNKGIEMPKRNPATTSRQTIATTGRHKATAPPVFKERPSIYYKKPNKDSPNRVYRNFNDRFIQRLTINGSAQSTSQSGHQQGIVGQSAVSNISSKVPEHSSASHAQSNLQSTAETAVLLTTPRRVAANPKTPFSSGAALRVLNPRVACLQEATISSASPALPRRELKPPGSPAIRRAKDQSRVTEMEEVERLLELEIQQLERDNLLHLPVTTAQSRPPNALTTTVSHMSSPLVPAVSSYTVLPGHTPVNSRQEIADHGILQSSLSQHLINHPLPAEHREQGSVELHISTSDHCVLSRPPNSFSNGQPQKLSFTHAKVPKTPAQTPLQANSSKPALSAIQQTTLQYAIPQYHMGCDAPNAKQVKHCRDQESYNQQPLPQQQSLHQTPQVWHPLPGSSFTSFNRTQEAVHLPFKQAVAPHQGLSLTSQQMHPHSQQTFTSQTPQTCIPTSALEVVSGKKLTRLDQVAPESRSAPSNGDLEMYPSLQVNETRRDEEEKSSSTETCGLSHWSMQSHTNPSNMYSSAQSYQGAPDVPHNDVGSVQEISVSRKFGPVSVSGDSAVNSSRLIPQTSLVSDGQEPCESDRLGSQDKVAGNSKLLSTTSNPLLTHSSPQIATCFANCDSESSAKKAGIHTYVYCTVTPSKLETLKETHLQSHMNNPITPAFPHNLPYASTFSIGSAKAPAARASNHAYLKIQTPKPVVPGKPNTAHLLPKTTSFAKQAYSDVDLPIRTPMAMQSAAINHSTMDGPIPFNLTVDSPLARIVSPKVRRPVVGQKRSHDLATASQVSLSCGEEGAVAGRHQQQLQPNVNQLSDVLEKVEAPKQSRIEGNEVCRPPAIWSPGDCDTDVATEAESENRTDTRLNSAVKTSPSEFSSEKSPVSNGTFQQGSLSLGANLKQKSPYRLDLKVPRFTMLGKANQLFHDALLDEEVALYTCRLMGKFSAKPAMERDFNNPVAMVLEEGDTMHFIPVKDEVINQGLSPLGSAFSAYTL
ncbi:uncharacterized protein [Ptychodera flava]|uniref:uncharacterized protein isoform X2 n=1 Tax=Ptychodera flava TaxID=63121 RepID=UPI00396A80A3